MKNKIRKVFKFLQAKETEHDEYGNNGYVVLSGKKYFVGCMSFDEWYLEPYYKGRTETSGFFPDETLWENGDTIQILQLFEDNGFIKVEVL